MTASGSGSTGTELDGKSLAEAPLTALAEVPAGSLWQRLSDEVLLMFQ